MIIKIQPLEMWTGAMDEGKAIYMDVPDSVDIDYYAENNPDKFYYGENHFMLVQELESLGAKVIPCPIRIIVV